MKILFGDAIDRNISIQVLMSVLVVIISVGLIDLVFSILSELSDISLSYTFKDILIYSLLMLPIIIFPYWINFSGLIYLIPVLILTIYYNVICFDLYQYKKNKFNLKKAKKVFGYSILYLFLIFVLLLIDSLI